MIMAVAAKKETHSFETDVDQILHLVTHYLYSNKEIFLRELISNASDAVDKLRFDAVSDNTLYEKDADLKITISFDKDTKTITVTDNGIGMSRQEVIDHIGTIAKSGTQEFLSQLTGNQTKDSNLIGQFGVGFYSTFIVADKVTVKTRRAGLNASEGVLWSSTGKGGYLIETIEKPTRGTEITLHLKKAEDEFLSEWKLRGIITKYSDHISWPILMQKPPTADETDETGKSSDEGESTQTVEGKKESPKKEPPKEQSKKPEFETINRATALWTLQKSSIKDDEYKALYKHISHDFQDPLVWTHNHVEGKQHYISLLFIPSQRPFDMWSQESKHGVKLFVKRVFIMDDAAQFLPRYLRFVKGIVDSSDLPLNISREILQENKLVEAIRAACIKRVLGLLGKLAENDKEKYAKFWSEFGLALKEGPIEDSSNRERIIKLLRFSSTHNDDSQQEVSLDDYIKRRQKDQEKIYYITAPSFNSAKHSPHLEVFRKKGIEVLLLSDRVDEWLVTHVSEYDGKSLQSVTKGELDLGGLSDVSEEETKKVEEEYDSLLKQVKKTLGDQVKDVRITHRLTDSPACIVSDTNDMGLEMQRLLQTAGQQTPGSKPILELNIKHPLLKKLNEETDDDRFAQWCNVLFGQAVLAEGGQLDDAAKFVQKLNEMLLSLSK